MRRVAIHGNSGSGKSTLGRSLAKKLGVKYVELDAHWHEPNWKLAGLEVFRARVADEIAQNDGWIMDGNYRHTQDLVYAHCDTIIWLDYSLPVLLWRLTRRTFRRGLTREELWKGNRESLWRHFFTRESLYVWVLSTYKRRRQQCQDCLARPDLTHLERLHFRTPRELKNWLRII